MSFSGNLALLFGAAVLAGSGLCSCAGIASIDGQPGPPDAAWEGGGSDSGVPRFPDGGPARGPDGGGDAGPSADAGVPDSGVFDAGSQWPPVTCVVALQDRLQTTPVSVAPASVDVGSDDGWATNRPIHLAPLASGSKVAWSASDNHVHVTPLLNDDSRAGPDLVLEGESVRGFVARPDGTVALLVVRGQQMLFIRLGPTGTVLTEKVLVGSQPATEDGSKYLHSWGHQGRLVWTGSSYAAYFGHNQNFGPSVGTHQGDLLWMLDDQGTVVGGGWDWGCSHSLDLRLAISGSDLGPVCLSDAYPHKAILFGHYGLLREEPSGNMSGYSSARLGGLAPVLDGGFALTFLSEEGRCATPAADGGCESTARDVGFMRIGAGGQPQSPVWLTATPTGEDEAGLGPYGAHLLAAWVDGAGTHLETLTADGTVLEGPATVFAPFSYKNDFVGFPNGDLGWAYSWGGGQNLNIVRVRRCE